MQKLGARSPSLFRELMIYHYASVDIKVGGVTVEDAETGVVQIIKRSCKAGSASLDFILWTSEKSLCRPLFLERLLSLD